MTHLRRNAVAYLALFVALSTGTAYAAGQIANGSVTTKKLAKNAVVSKKIKNGTVRAQDLKAGTLPKADWMMVFPGGFDPPAAPEQGSITSKSVTVPRSGSLLVRLDLGDVAVSCSQGQSFTGLYLDGVAVPGTGEFGPTSSARRDVVKTAIVKVTAGSHTASLGIDCPTGTFGSASVNGNLSWTFVLNGD